MWDREAKKRLGYVEEKTRVWTDEQGNVVREVLHGKDWKRRKEELFRRAGFQCEYELRPGIRCTADAVDPCHVEPRHPIRNDMLSNLMAGCRPCHIKHDKQTPKRQLHFTAKRGAGQRQPPKELGVSGAPQRQRP